MRKMGNAAGGVASLVGRERDLDELMSLLDAAERRRGRMAVILGEPGIGKTALVDTLTAQARDRGIPAAVGRCTEVDAPSFWPWRQVFGTLGVDALDTTETTTRAEMFARVVDQLATLDQPTLLVLEDIHWADPGSLALIRFVADAVPGLPVLLVTTARGEPAEANAEAVALLRSLPTDVERLVLSGLDAEASVTVATEVLGEPPTDELAARIADRCGGNPFFVREVARLHISRGSAATASVPAAVQQVLERRLARLSPSCRGLLAAAAVAGDAHPDLLAEVISEEPATVRHQVSEAVAAGVVQSDGSCLSFGHALVRETVYAQQSASDLAWLHRRVAEVLETWSASGPDSSSAAGADVRPAAGPDAARLAAHWRRADGVDARHAAARWALAAARAARGRMGYEQAAQFYEWALETPPEDPLTLRIELGETRVLAGNLSAGRTTLRQAARAALDADRLHEAAQAVLGVGVGGFEVALGDDEQVELLERVLEHLASPQDDPLRAAVLARLSVASTWRRPADDRAAMAEESLRLTRLEGDTAGAITALAAWCDARSGPDHTEDRLDRSDQMIDMAVRADDLTSLLLARRLRLVALAERGDFTGVDAEIDAYARVCDRLRLPLYAWPVPIWRGARALMSGDMEAARRHLVDAEALCTQTDSVNAPVVALVLKANLLTAAGEHSSVAAATDRHREILGPHYDDVDVLAYYYAVAGRDDEARRMLRRKQASGLVRPKDAEYLSELWLLGAAAVALGDNGVAAHLYEALRPYGDHWVINSMMGTCLGFGAHQLGSLAAILGHHDDARHWWQRAREAYHSVGARLLVDQVDRAVDQHTSAASVSRAVDLPTGATGVSRAVDPLTGSTRAAPTAHAGEKGPNLGEFRRTGRVWHVRWDGVSATVPDSKGMRDIATLLAAPGREVHVLDLVEAAGGPPAATAGGHTGERLDATARRAYRQRLADIEEELTQVQTSTDVGRAERLRDEHEFIAAELAGALSLGGRVRTDHNPVERARKAVAMRIRTALKAIAEVHPSLATHLDRSLTKGRLCAYRPDRPVRWQTSSG